MKKKLFIGLLVIPLAFGLSACGSSESTSSEPYVAPQDMDTNPSDEQGFIAAVRSVDNQIIAYGSSSDLLEIGQNVCNSLDSGETVASIAVTLAATQDTTEGEQAAFAIIAGAVIYLCPEYKYQADNLQERLCDGNQQYCWHKLLIGLSKRLAKFAKMTDIGKSAVIMRSYRTH